MTPKFRAWDKEEHLMIYDIQSTYDCQGPTLLDGSDYDNCDETCFGDFFNDKRYVVEQFTGVLDSEGTMIYEHDVIEFELLNGRLQKCVVTFEEDSGAFSIGAMSLWKVAARGKVIGNWYENGEAL
jgi:hypothetical protein